MSHSTRGVAVVTGAARGLGLAIAEGLHRDGYSVLLTDVDEAAVAAAAKPLSGWSARLDVRYDQACQAIAVKAGEGEGGLTLWVNNAGVLATGPSWTHDAATRRRLLEVNALGAMSGTLAALEVMRAQGHGHVINVVSLAGLVAAPGESGVLSEQTRVARLQHRDPGRTARRGRDRSAHLVRLPRRYLDPDARGQAR